MAPSVIIGEQASRAIARERQLDPIQVDSELIHENAK
jgi:hypothetical protein